MALLIEQSVDVPALVSDGVVDAYTARRERVKAMSLGELLVGTVGADLGRVGAVVAADARVVEIIADDHFDLERLAGVSWTLAGRGWDVVVLVACNRMGDAHMALRAAPCALQPWWFDDAGVWFGAPETP